MGAYCYIQDNIAGSGHGVIDRQLYATQTIPDDLKLHSFFHLLGSASHRTRHPGHRAFRLPLQRSAHTAPAELLLPPRQQRTTAAQTGRSGAGRPGSLHHSAAGSERFVRSVCEGTNLHDLKLPYHAVKQGFAKSVVSISLCFWR